MTTTILDISFLCVGENYDTTAFNPDIPKLVLKYNKNPNDSSDTYCYLSGEADFQLINDIPCSEVVLCDYYMETTHSAANDVKAPFHVDVDFLKVYQLKGMPLANSFSIQTTSSSNPSNPVNKLKFATRNNKLPKRFKIRMRQTQWTDDHGSQQFSSQDAYVVSLKFAVPVERI